MIISDRSLDSLKKKGISVPSYDRGALKHSIVHIGMGHFHRSHFLTYLDMLLRSGAYDGGVFEVDVVPANNNFVDAFRKQDYLYSVLSIAPDGAEELRINGPVIGYANHSREPETVIRLLADSETKLITLTITEKGYCYRDDIGSIDWDNPQIIHDIASSDPPLTAIGCLAEALARRYKENSPVTIMSCDNVPENGRMLRECIIQFCRRKFPEAAGWIEESIAFPCTMVDRITPGTGSEDIRRLKEKYDLEDDCAVHCEKFMQWVIEDSFCTPVPDFSKVGALVVKDVRPYELMKIRLLNGSHSALSYPSYMMGYRMVHEAVSDPLIRRFIRSFYMDEIARTLPPVPGVDISTYEDELISRFSNPYIADTILRLASDGSKKISNAILRPLEEGLASGLSMDHVIMALVLWNQFYIHLDENGNHMPIDDPKCKELIAVASDPIAFFRIAGLSEKVLSYGGFISKVKTCLSVISRKGIRRAIAESL